MLKMISLSKWFLMPLALMVFAPSGKTMANSFSNVDVVFKGAGWLKSGMVMHSTDYLTGNGANDYNKNWMQDAGVLFTGIVSLNENFDAAFGLGAIQRHPLQGALVAPQDLDAAAKVKLSLNVFSTQSRLTWFPQGKTDYNHRFDFGLFPYKYDYDIKNLGLYLIRGAVYPGLLVSGFETKEMLGTANMLGARMQNRFGTYTQDIILTSETDLKPFYDFSALYVGTWKPTPLFELGAGVNFYHFLPVRPGATSPSEADGFDPSAEGVSQIPHRYNRVFASPRDTIVIPLADRENPFDSLLYTNYIWPSHKGIKLMGRFSINPQNLFPNSGILGKNDLKLYGEIGVLGVQDYPGIYDKIQERIPVMIGFNIPAFKILDVLALEVEYYGSQLVPDYRKLVSEGSPMPQTPWVNRNEPQTEVTSETDLFLQTPYDVDGDNLKWSLYFSKVLANHVRISGQVANDHFRPGGTPSGASFEPATTSISDWYWMLKLSYFF